LFAVVGVVELERAGNAEKSAGRFSVSERRRSWLASSVWVRVCGPRDSKRVRKEEAIVAAVGEHDADAEEKRRLERWGERKRVRAEYRVVAGERSMVCGDTIR
jgi:hypothetical protein